jgi:hypothetical protein
MPELRDPEETWLACEMKNISLRRLPGRLLDADGCFRGDKPGVSGCDGRDSDGGVSFP